MKMIILSSFLFLTACQSPKKHLDITYKKVNQEELTLDVYLPEGQGPFPVVFTVHGGSWKGGNKRHMKNIGYKLACAGFAVVNISYRFAPDSHYPAPIEDLTDAVEWAKINANKYQLDFTKLNFWGYSAGSQISTLTALRISKKYPVKSIINGAGPLHFELYPNDQVIEKYLGTKDKSVWSEASVFNSLSKNTPPIFSYHSTNDHLVDFAHTETIHEKLNQLGVENKIHTIPYLGHILTFLFSSESKKLAIDFLKIHNELSE